MVFEKILANVANRFSHDKTHDNPMMNNELKQGIDFSNKEIEVLIYL